MRHFANTRPINMRASYSSEGGNKSSEVFEEVNSSSTNSSKSNIKTTKPRIKKKTNNICYTLNLLERTGNINVVLKGDKIFISKITKIDFKDNFKELLDLGKSNLGSYFKQETGSIPDITFWYQRYYYYSRFDDGIKMDNECWWSVTPEEISKYIAELCKDKTVIDGFCGSGGNVIQFSKYCKRVYAIDIDETRLNICRNNCKVYECLDNIEFIKSDYLLMNNKIEGDYVFLSPPWGGIKYKDSEVYSIKELMTPDIRDIIQTSLSLARNIIFYLPRTLLITELFEILSGILDERNLGEGKKIFFDVHVLKSAKKIKALLIIFGSDIDSCISSNDLGEYLSFNYNNISYRNTQILTAIAKIVGNYKFLSTEFNFKKMHQEKNSEREQSDHLIRYFFNNVLTDDERTKLKSYKTWKLLKSPIYKQAYVKFSNKLATINEIQFEFLLPSERIKIEDCHDTKEDQSKSNEG